MNRCKREMMQIIKDAELYKMYEEISKKESATIKAEYESVINKADTKGLKALLNIMYNMAYKDARGREKALSIQ